MWRTVNQNKYEYVDAVSDYILYNDVGSLNFYKLLFLVNKIANKELKLNDLSKIDKYSWADIEKFAEDNKSIQDEVIIQRIVDTFIENNKPKIEEYKNGNTKLFNTFIGAIKKEHKAIDGNDTKRSFNR